MSESEDKLSQESHTSAEDVSKKLDMIIKRLDTLEELILQKPEYEELAVPLRLTRMGLGLYEEPLRMATELKTAERVGNKSEVAREDIQTRVILGAKEAKVGEDVSLEIEMVNVSEAAVRLVRIENIIPEGFRPVKTPKAYRVEGSCLNMKGKLLAPHSTVEGKMLLRSLTKGAFFLRPKILYVDKTGKYRSHEPVPVSIVVKELGISGWIKGRG
jgi:hypothetical protein